MQNDELKMLTREEVSKLFNTTKDHISTLSDIGILKPIKIGKCYMFSREGIREMQREYMGMDLSNRKCALRSYALVQERKEIKNEQKLRDVKINRINT